MESAMRMIEAASLVAMGAMLACAPARADSVPPFKGNDTGGIIAYSLAQPTDARPLAVDHWASYGKAGKVLAIDAPYCGPSFVSRPRGAHGGDQTARAPLSRC